MDSNQVRGQPDTLASVVFDVKFLFYFYNGVNTLDDR